jgi:hypothetical protein
MICEYRTLGLVIKYLCHSFSFRTFIYPDSSCIDNNKGYLDFLNSLFSLLFLSPMDGKLFVIVDHLQVLGLEYIHSLFSIFYHLLLDKFTEFTVVAPSCLENSAIVLVIPLDLVFRYVVLSNCFNWY